MRVRRELFTLQAIRRVALPGAGAARVGFTVTKKVGNAVVRNRIKRRLRAATSELCGAFLPATDYVIVARVEALRAPFDRLKGELADALSLAGTKLARFDDRSKKAVEERA